MSDLLLRMNQSVAKAQDAASTTYQVLTGPADVPIDVNGQEVPSLTTRVRDYINNSVSDIQGDDGVSLELLEIRADGHLWAKIEGLAEEDLGQIVPDEPVGVSSVDYDEFSGNLTITLTDGTINGPFDISGANASVPQFAEIDQGNLKITLEDDTVLNAGDVSRFGGRSANGADITESGDLVILFTDGTTKNIGRVRGEAGKQGYSLVTAGIDSFGILRFLRSDGRQATAGLVNATILDNAGNTVLDVGLGLNGAADDELVVSLESGDLNLGKVVGEDGADGEDGKGIKSIGTDDDNNVIYTLTDDSTHNVGKLQVTRVFNAGNTNISEAKIDQATGELLIDVTINDITTTERLDVVVGTDGTVFDSAAIDETTSELVFTDTDGNTINAGVVEQKTITNVEVTDPNGFLEITTSDGSKFTSTNTVLGSDGADASGILDAYLDDNGHLMVAFEDTNIPDADLGDVTAAAETGVDLTNGELTFTMSDGQTFGPFTVQGRDGRYLTAAEIDQGDLYVTYSDDPSNKINVGQVEQHPVNAKINNDNTLTIEFDDGSSVTTTERVGANDGDTINNIRYDSANDQIVIDYTTDNLTNSEQVKIDVVRGYGVTDVTYDSDGGMVNIETTIPDREIIQFPAPRGKDGGSINNIYKDNDDLVIEYTNRGESTVNEFRAEGVYASGTIESIEVDGNDNLAIFVDTLDNPLVFQTLKGADGNTITSINFDDRDLVISTSELPDVTVPLVRGEDGLTIDTIGTNDANDELSIGMSDGTSVSFPQKKGKDAEEAIVDIRLGGNQNRDLVIQKTSETLTVPLLKGEDGTTMKNIDLTGEVFSFDVDDGTNVDSYSFDFNDLRGTDGKSVTDIEMGGSTGRDLIITTNLPEPDNQIVIPVVKGKDGVTVSSISMVNDDKDIEILLSDTTKYVLNGVGASVTGAEVTTEGKLKLTLSDGSEVVSENMVRGRDGLGIGVVDATFTNGQLTVTIEDPDGTQTDIDAGDVSMVGVTGARIEEDTTTNKGILFIDLEDGTSIEVGNVFGENGRYVENVALSDPSGPNNDRDLLLTFNDGVEVNAGTVTGQAGRSITNAAVSFGGDLTVEYDSGDIELVGNIGTGAGLSVWDSNETPYVKDQVVIRDGGLYMSKTDGNNDQPPSDKWNPLAFGDQITPIRKPAIVAPIGSGLSPRPRLKATPYAPIVSEDDLDYREYQIDVITGNFSNPVYTSNEAREYHDVSGMDLTADQEYKIRVRDVSTRGDKSQWSEEESFTVPASAVETPVLNIHPDEDSSDAFLAPEWQTTDFSVTSGDDTHASTSWEVRDSTDTLVYTSLDDTDNLLSIIIPFGILTKGESYEIRAKHKGTSGESGWSDWNSFVVNTIDYIKTPVVADNGVTFESSPFEKTDAFAAYPNTGISHVQSNWTITKVSDGTVAESGSSSQEGLTEYTIKTALTSNEVYRTTVEYVSDRFGSVVSSPYEFTFTQSIEAPTISTEEDINAFPIGGTVNSSTFIGVNEVHISTDWEMRSVLTDEIVASSYNDTENLRQIQFNPVSDAGDYYVRARYNGDYISSDWSAQFTFYYAGREFILYTASSDNSLRRIDLNGDEVWAYGGSVESDGWGSTVSKVVIDKEGNSFSSSGNTVKKLDPLGNELKSTSANNSFDVDEEENIYYPSGDRFYKYDFLGNQLWQNYENRGYGRVATTSSHGNVYAYESHYRSEYFFGYNMSNGSQVFRISLGDIDTTPVVGTAGDYVYHSRGNTIYKRYKDGTSVWTYNPSEGRPRCIAADDYGNMYVGYSSSKVKKVDSIGNEVWTFDGHTGQVYGIDVDVRGNVFTASADNTVRRINPDGTEYTGGNWPFTGHTNNVNDIAVIQ